MLLVRDLVFQSIKIVLDWLILSSLSNTFVQHILRNFYICMDGVVKYCTILLYTENHTFTQHATDAALHVPEYCELHRILI